MIGGPAHGPRSVYEPFLDGDIHRLVADEDTVSVKAAIVAIRAAANRRGLRFVCERIGHDYYVQVHA